MESLSPVAKRLGIRLSLIEPGPVNTAFVADTYQPRPEAPQEPYRAMLADFLARGKRVYHMLGQSGEEVARVIGRVATRKRPAFRYTTSRMVSSSGACATGSEAVADPLVLY